MNLSFWEYSSWIKDIDYCIVGSGITGLSCALQLRKESPKARILVLEKGWLPDGASTKNAGFACFGSVSEILDDLETLTEDEVVALVQKRKNGLSLLRENLGDLTIDYQARGGYELFPEKDTALYQRSLDAISRINNILKPVFGDTVFKETSNIFGFKHIMPRMIVNQFEGQLDTGKLMQSLLKKATSQNILVLNGITVKSFKDQTSSVQIETDRFSLSAKKLLVATNGFSFRLGLEEVEPARAQVLITKPVQNLAIKGTFHLDRGYYYFRNIGNRVLLGGGRHIDFQNEKTDVMSTSSLIQDALEHLLKTCILPNAPVEIERKWSGIMGVGTSRQPIVKNLSKNVSCGVRLGGMGIAIGSLVGRDLANITLQS